MMKLSLIVPCYNEEKNLVLLIDRFRGVIDGRTGIEVILVNNGSRDGSAKVLDAELSKIENTFARSVDVPMNRGYGHGILAGLQAAHGEYLGWTHADLQTDPNDLILGFDQLMNQADAESSLLRGRRIGRNTFDSVFTFGMSCISSAALGVWLHDINAQPKIFHRSFYESWRNAPEDFSLDLYVLFLAKQRQLKIVELPVEFKNRLAGVAKGGGTVLGKYKLVIRTLKYIVALRREVLDSQNKFASQQVKHCKAAEYDSATMKS